MVWSGIIFKNRKKIYIYIAMEIQARGNEEHWPLRIRRNRRIKEESEVSNLTGKSGIKS